MTSEDKKRIIRNFSRAASSYDRYAIAQQRCALDLLHRIPPGTFESILEIGCGTGIYTKLLKDKFSSSSLKAIDISEEMIEIAKGKLNGKEVEFFVCDAEERLPDGKFDMITSNACFQWFKDPAGVFKKYAKLLEEGGAAVFSIFGPDTFSELGTVLASFFKGSGIRAEEFSGKDELFPMLKKCFKRVEIDEKRYYQEFPSLPALLKTINYTGTGGGMVRRRPFLSRTRLSMIEKEYKELFGSITATHHVFFCRCR